MRTCSSDLMICGDVITWEDTISRTSDSWGKDTNADDPCCCLRTLLSWVKGNAQNPSN